MRKAFFLVLLFTAFVNRSAAQHNTGLLRAVLGGSGILIYGNLVESNAGYCSINFTGGNLFYGARSGQLQVSFPYTATDSAGIVSNRTFTSKKIDPYPRPRPFFGGSFEIGNARHFADLRMSGSLGAIKYSVGYGPQFLY